MENISAVDHNSAQRQLKDNLGEYLYPPHICTRLGYRTSLDLPYEFEESALSSRDFILDQAFISCRGVKTLEKNSNNAVHQSSW